MGKGAWGNSILLISLWENREYNPKMHRDWLPQYTIHINKSPADVWPSSPSIMRDLSAGTFWPIYEATSADVR